MWTPVVQLQLQLTHPLSLSEWATLEDFELEPQSYDGGNVLHGLCNQISSSAHSSVVQCHVEFQDS